MAEAEAEAEAFRAPKPPEITTSDSVPLTSNNELIDQRIRAVHTALLGPKHIVTIPYCYWVFGGHSQELYDAAPGDTLMAKLSYLPSNHQPTFAPEPESTLRVGVRALTSGALTYLPIAGAI